VPGVSKKSDLLVKDIRRTAGIADSSVVFTVGPREKTLQAIAYKEGLEDSAIAIGTYAYEPPY
jgi:hypothetical protein